MKHLQSRRCYDTDKKLLNIIDCRTFANMPPSVLDGGVAVDVGQKSQTESLGVVGRIRVSVDDHGRRRCMEHLADAVVQLVVRDRRPVALLLICYRLHVYK